MAPSTPTVSPNMAPSTPTGMLSPGPSEASPTVLPMNQTILEEAQKAYNFSSTPVKNNDTHVKLVINGKSYNTLPKEEYNDVVGRYPSFVYLVDMENAKETALYDPLKHTIYTETGPQNVTNDKFILMYSGVGKPLSSMFITTKKNEYYMTIVDATTLDSYLAQMRRAVLQDSYLIKFQLK